MQHHRQQHGQDDGVGDEQAEEGRQGAQPDVAEGEFGVDGQADGDDDGAVMEEVDRGGILKRFGQSFLRMSQTF